MNTQGLMDEEDRLVCDTSCIKRYVDSVTPFSSAPFVRSSSLRNTSSYPAWLNLSKRQHFVIMVKIFKVASAIATALVIGTAVAHPGEKLTHAQIKREVQARTALSNKAYRSLSDCANSPNARALQEQAVKRRAATAERLRKERGLKPQGVANCLCFSWNH